MIRKTGGKWVKKHLGDVFLYNMRVRIES